MDNNTYQYVLRTLRRLRRRAPLEDLEDAVQQAALELHLLAPWAPDEPRAWLVHRARQRLADMRRRQYHQQCLTAALSDLTTPATNLDTRGAAAWISVRAAERRAPGQVRRLLDAYARVGCAARLARLRAIELLPATLGGAS